MPKGARTYHEPFVGGGAVFFAFRASGSSGPAFLNDANAQLMECYRTVRDSLSDVIGALTFLSDQYLAREGSARADFYYEQRGQEPNEPVKRTARFIFLNRTAYNGLYRVNAAGRFNVPHGRYKQPRIVDVERLEEASKALRNCRLRGDDFEEACRRAEPGDFVYLDPPYQPLTATSRFTSYTAASFGPSDQERLAGAFKNLTNRRVTAVLSNSDHETILDLYEGLGYEIQRVSMARSINSKGNRRNPIRELLVSNIDAVG